MLKILTALVNSDASKMQLLTESFQAAKDLNIYLNIFVQGVSACDDGCAVNSEICVWTGSTGFQRC